MKTLLDLLTDCFSENDTPLRLFCFDDPLFLPVYQKLTAKSTSADFFKHVDGRAHLHVRNKSRLLDFIQKINPESYQKYLKNQKVISFVIVTMTHTEASNLFGKPSNVLKDDSGMFLNFKKIFLGDNPTEWLAHYSDEQDDWKPDRGQSIRQTIEKLVHQKFSNEVKLPAWLPSSESKSEINISNITLQFCSADFFARNDNVRQEMIKYFEKGCIIIIDAISLFHPDLYKKICDFHLGTIKESYTLILFPVNKHFTKVNRLMQDICAKKMNPTLLEFKKYKRQYEIGILDPSDLERWLLCAIDDLGKPSSYKDVLSGRQ